MNYGVNYSYGISPGDIYNPWAYCITHIGDTDEIDGNTTVDDSYNQPDYWWLRSPNHDVGNVVWCVRDDGGFSGFFESVDYNSYGRVFTTLRGPVTATVRTMWIRMAASATTFRVSRIIPTEDIGLSGAWK